MICLKMLQKFRELLEERGIETRRFFPPLYLQPPLLERQAVNLKKMPVAEQLWEQVIILPFGSGKLSQKFNTFRKLLLHFYLNFSLNHFAY